jgi:hypothetical protein
MGCSDCGPLRVTDILMRGGGGTITFSDDVTIEFVFQFKQDPNMPGGGCFGVTLQGPRAAMVYQTCVSQSLCDMIDWVMQCSSLNHRVAELELAVSQLSGSTGTRCCPVEFSFSADDWNAGTPNQLTIVNTGPLGPGIIGAHNLGTNRVFHISVFRDDGTPVFVKVNIEIDVNVATGTITIVKTSLGASFAGYVIIS